MGTIFKHKNKYIQCRNLEKKLKKLKINKDDIEIIKDNIPNDSLELEFVNLTKKEKLRKIQILLNTIYLKILKEITYQE